MQQGTRAARPPLLLSRAVTSTQNTTAGVPLSGLAQRCTRCTFQRRIRATLRTVTTGEPVVTLRSVGRPASGYGTIEITVPPRIAPSTDITAATVIETRASAWR